MTPEERKERGMTLRPVEFLSISPSQPIDEMACDYINELPNSIKLFLRLTGATAHGGGVSAASYLLFSKGFCQKLVELGYKDGLKQADDIRNFFQLDQQNEPAEQGAASTHSVDKRPEEQQPLESEEAAIFEKPAFE